MAYKIKKTNKRGYGYLQKKRTRQTRKIYGGNDNQELVQNNEESVPTFMSNLTALKDLAGSAVSNYVAKGIQNAAEAVGIDPNKSMDINMGNLKNNLQNINRVLNSPEGEQLKEEAKKILADSVEIVEPSVKKIIDEGNELIKKEIPIIGNMANDAVLMIPGAGQVIGAVEEVGNVAQASEAAIEGVANLTSTGTDTINNLKEQKKKTETLLGNFKDTLNNISSEVNKTVSSGINAAQQHVNKEGININSQMKNMVPQSDPMKYMQKNAKMIGGRIRQSQLDFLEPHILRKKQNGGKWITKRVKNYRRASRRR
jgi:ElaB/YqjD/DUF883 family membrane-anchored ribosome-binding protein